MLLLCVLCIIVSFVSIYSYVRYVGSDVFLLCLCTFSGSIYFARCFSLIVDSLFWVLRVLGYGLL